MDLNQGQSVSELFQAQAHIYKHVFNFISSMSLKCAVQLGIPDIIHNHNQPIALPELVSALQVPPEKRSWVYRLMRLLVYSGFFATKPVSENQEGYVLTPSSRLLLKDASTGLSPFLLGMLDPALVTPWHFLGASFHGNDITAFETAHGMSLWEYGNQSPEFNNVFNQAMASDSQLVNMAIRDCKPVFEGLGSLVDVGGGTGILARFIAEAFPRLKCTVLDLPHVVAGLQGSKNLNYVGGDMFQCIPSAEALLLKLMLHAWSDEECIKILKKCREAIPSKDEGGKVIIIDIVINSTRDELELTEPKLFFDLLMMVVVTGRESNEEEWEKLFLEAGFTHYKITPLFGLRSLIEVYP